MTEELITAKSLGQRGGRKTLENRGKNYFKELNRKSTEAKRKKKLEAETAQTGVLTTAR